ncbi:MAG: hypothetical protein K9I25_05725 [Crocinitomicaceae bacterium]|nr:hypothetical protein [Crocinitomicaceae bacterium]
MTYQNTPIEVWFIELFDGTLSEEATHEFLAFCLINNIDVPEDLPTLMPSEDFLQTKDGLKFPAHESILNDPKQDLLLSYKEGLLNASDAQWVEQQIEANRTWKTLHTDFSATYLVPEPYEFLEKKVLYKEQPPRWWLTASMAAAAVFIGLMLFLFPFKSNESGVNKPTSKFKEKTKKIYEAQTAQPDISFPTKTAEGTKDLSVPTPIKGIVVSSSRDCILHPDEYTKDEITPMLSNVQIPIDSLERPRDELTQIEAPKNNEKTLRSWIKERLIERIFDREDNALVLERETKWFNQSIGIKYKRQEDRSISQVKLGPFIFEWNKKNKNSNFLSMLPSNQ